MWKKLLLLFLPVWAVASPIPTTHVPSLCVDVRAASSVDGTVVQTYACNGTNAQDWIFSGTQVKAFGKCLSNSANRVINGNKINLWTCNGGPDQNWIVQGSTLQLQGTQKCLDITDGNFVNSNPLQIWDCQAGNPNQSFLFPPQPTPSSTPSAVPSPIASPYPGYTLVWAENFRGTQLDLSKWNVEVNGNGGGNNEQEYYTNFPANVSVSNGVLSLTALVQNYLGKPYTSGRINTSGKFSFLYGRIDVRAQLPIGQGMWPGIWMLPQDNAYGGWPLSGEIDILEERGRLSNIAVGSLNYGDPWPGNKFTNNTYTLPQGNFNQAFHTFSVDWQPNVIKWYVDGILYSTKTPASLGMCQAGPCPWRFDKRFFIILNNAVGGNFDGNANTTTPFPQSLKVDWIQVYQ